MLPLPPSASASSSFFSVATGGLTPLAFHAPSTGVRWHCSRAAGTGTGIRASIGRASFAEIASATSCTHSRKRRGGIMPLRASEQQDMDEDERELKRLERILDLRLVLAGDVMKEDVPALAALAATQALPVLAGGSVGANFGFFWATAVLSVYLGSKRAAATAKAGEVFQSLNVKNAIAAPIAASFSLFSVYYLLKTFSLDIRTIYQLMTTGFGWWCLRDVAASGLLASGVIPGSVGGAEVDTQDETDDAFRGPVGMAKNVGSVIAAVVCAAYLWASGGAHGDLAHLSREAQSCLLLAANAITVGIALQAQTTMSLKSLRPAILFLAGLFLYDIYWVFLSPGSVMETVATSVEGPVKFLSPRAVNPSQGSFSSYPFSILGLGDVVIPGIFVGLLKKLDDSIAENSDDPEASGNGAFFKAGLFSYGLGLVLTFIANIVSARGQPALLYINPCLLVGALTAAATTGQWEQLWNFGEEKPEQEKA